MSIRITYPGVSPSDIWSYSTRKLTERFVIIERARGYSSGLSKIYDETRFINAILYLLGNNRGAIIIFPDDDIAYNKTFSALTTPSSGAFPSCVTDHNDSTYCQWTFGATGTYDLVSLDMNSQIFGILRINLYLYYTSGTLIVYGSNDGSTWTQIFSLYVSGGNSYDLWIYVASPGYRYYKITYSTSSVSAGNYFNLNSIEYYLDSALPTSRSFSNIVKNIKVWVYNSYYQLLEVISI